MPEHVEGGLEGWRFVLPAVLVFLLPLLLALLGAVLCRGDQDRQFLGVLVGLGVGVVLALVSKRFIRNKDSHKENR